MEKEKSIIYAAWSAMFNHLSGRVRVEFEDLKPGVHPAIYIELGNHGIDTISIANKPIIDASLFDVAHNLVNTIGSVGNGPMPISQLAMIPSGAYIGFRIDWQGAGTPIQEQHEILLATGEKKWLLEIGQYSLKIKAVFNKIDNNPVNQWVGELDLPPLNFAVTEQMFMR